MMNDTQTTPLSIQLLDTEPQSPEHSMSRANIDTLIGLLTDHIDMLVERRFNQLVENTKALSLLDEQLREYITEQIDDAISNHENNYDHNDFVTENRVAEIVSVEADHYLRHAEHGLTTEGQVDTMIRDALSEFESDLDETIERKLDSATISICL